MPIEPIEPIEPITAEPDPLPISPTLPWLTGSLIAMNAVIFVAMVITGVSPLTPNNPSLIRWGANVGQLTVQGQWWRLFTCIFLHIGFVHLLFNMVVLWSIGGILERLAGRTGMAVIYLLAGLFGSLASIGWNPDVVAAGASGAIFGLYGAILGFYVQNHPSLPKADLRRLAQNALWFVGFNMVLAFGKQGIDIAAHLGGLVGGFACGAAMALPGGSMRPIRRRTANGGILLAGLAVIAVLAALIPQDRGVTGALAQADRIETKALKTFDDAAQQARVGTLKDGPFAELIQREVIPGLHDYQSRLAAVVDRPGVNPRAIRAMIRFTQAREQAFGQLAQALRSGDAEQARLAVEQHATAAKAFDQELKHAQD